MHKSLLLFVSTLIFCLIACCFNVEAQEQDAWSYEQITFPDGETEEYYVYYDPFKEWLYIESEDGEVRYFLAEDVVSFEYRGSRYYSLPFESGAFSFFKVEYEGNKTALLSKPNSINLMQYLAKRYDKIYTLCDGFQGKNGVRLCKINYAVAGFSPLVLTRFLNSNEYHLIQKNLDPVQIKECLFVVGEKGMEIFQLNVDQELLMGLFTKDKKYGFEPLEDFFGKETYRRMHAYARKNKLKEHQLEDLKKIFHYHESL